jgi:drug/metabolite transporter (DMT)-like permease
MLGGFAWAALSVIIFSGWFVVTRFGVTHQLRIWDIVALRFGIGAILLLPALFGRANRLRRRDWSEGLLLAVLWGAPFVLFVALGIQLTSTAQASAITPTLMPVFAGLFGWLALREPFGRTRLLGYVAIIGGLAAMIFGNGFAAGRHILGGGLPSIIAAAMWGAYTLRFRRSGLTAFQAAALVCFWSAVLYLPAYWAFGLSRLGDATFREVAFQAVYQGVLMSAVAIVTFNRAVALLGSRSAAAIIALVPVTATVMAVPILGETPSLIGGVAIGFIAVGVILAAQPAASTQKFARPAGEFDDPIVFPPDTEPGQGRVVF